MPTLQKTLNPPGTATPMRPRPFLLLITGFALVLFYTMPNASADAILNVDGEGFHDYTSFGPVGGTAVFYITVSNDGDADYDDASISASFDDEFKQMKKEILGK
jgi:hypothetical protein